MSNTVQEIPSAALLETVAGIARHGVIGTGSTTITTTTTTATATTTIAAGTSGQGSTSTNNNIHNGSGTATESIPQQQTKAKATNHDRKDIIAAGTPNLTKVETVFCGSTAGVISRFVIAPLDVVKIRLQVQTQRKDLSSILRRTTEKSFTNDGTIPRMATIQQQPKYRGMFSGMATIAREEGIRGLWKGNMAAEYLYLTYGGIQFLVYQQTKGRLSSMATKLTKGSSSRNNNNYYNNSIIATIIGSSSAQSFVSGATAGITATAFTYPFDLLRTRFAVQRDVRVYTGVLQAFQHIYRKDGIKGYYRGMSPALIQVIPYMGIMFGSYDTLKQLTSWLKSRDEPVESSTNKSLSTVLLGLEDMLCGAMSGVISKTGVYPLDMVRKRLQIQGSEQQRTIVLSPSSSGATTMPRTVWRTMVYIVKQEGYLALYKGLVPGVLKAAPASAVTFLVFSQTGSLIERVRRPQQV
ncbi:mitochondrial thiamine pyrophosphate transporter [Podila humilis]|nr:mitochondrial thiamine pyrophosphate transporter [Podila humilis]